MIECVETNIGEKSLVFDERKDDEPGVHVFLAGVSKYPYLKGGEREGEVSYHNHLGQLSASALSAYSLFEWLTQPGRQLEQPLRTVRLLVSPVASELVVQPKLVKKHMLCNRKCFQAAARAWRQDADRNSKNIALFYFVGHGIEVDPEDPLLLLEDFKPEADDMFEDVVSLKKIYHAMAPSTNFPNIATRQFFFLDNCRDYPEEFHEYAREALNDTARILPMPRKPLPDTRDTLIIFACGELETAYAKPNKSTLFSRALIECLDRDAGTPPKGLGFAKSSIGSESKPWLVTADSLGQAIQQHFRLIINKPEARKQQMPTYNIGRHHGSTGERGDFAVHFMHSAPVVDINLALKPLETSDGFSVRVSRETDTKVILAEKPMRPNPREIESVGGFHSVHVRKESPPCASSDANLVTPRTHDWSVLLE
jgi:hypothetical protein